MLLRFAKGLDPDQVRQNFGQTFDTLMVFLNIFLQVGRRQQKCEYFVVYAHFTSCKKLQHADSWIDNLMSDLIE